jgi:chromosome segregation ATPase
MKMPSEVERQRKLVGDLEKTGIDLTGKLATARARKAALDASHKAALERLGNGDQSIRKEVNKLAAELAEADTDCAAFAAAMSATATKLTEAQKSLAFAQDTEAVTSLEAEIANFGVLDRELQNALSVVSQKSATLIAAVNAVGASLTQRDEKKYGALASQLTQQIRRAIFLHFETMHKPNAVPRPSFSDSIALEMRRIVAELRFELAGRTMQPGRGETLYRVVVACPGLRDVDSRPGDHLALRPGDQLTMELLKSGTITLADEQHATETSAAEVAA